MHRSNIIDFFASNENNVSMSRVYNTKEDAIKAVKKAVGLRHEWENAIRSKTTVEELEKKGLKTVSINEH